MNLAQSLRGVLSPVVTPFTADLRPDAVRLTRHCRWLLASDVGLAVFGTNSEGNSLTVAEKLALLEALVAAGIPAARMMPGTGSCSLTDRVELTRHAMSPGCGGVLMLPPFYYKGVSDDGLFPSYAEVIERVGEAGCASILTTSLRSPASQSGSALIERLLGPIPALSPASRTARATGTTPRRCRAVPPRGFDVFAGSETFLLARCAPAAPAASPPRAM